MKIIEQPHKILSYNDISKIELGGRGILLGITLIMQT